MDFRNPSVFWNHVRTTFGRSLYGILQTVQLSVFSAFDEDGDGFLNLEQVYQAIHSLGKVWPMKDIREALPKDCKEVDFPGKILLLKNRRLESERSETGRSKWSWLWSVEFLDFLAVMAQDLASDFNSEKDTDSIRGIFDFYDAFDRGYITHQQLRYDQVNSLMSHRSCDVWTYVFIQEIRERNRSMSLIIRDLKTGSNRPVSPETVIVSWLNYPNLILVLIPLKAIQTLPNNLTRTVLADHDLRKTLNLPPLELPWKWAKDWMKLKSPNS